MTTKIEENETFDIPHTRTGGDIYLECEAEQIYGIPEPEDVLKDKLKKIVKEKFSCSRSKFVNFLVGLFPFLRWIPKYKKNMIPGDLAAGCTVGIVNVPQGMAYALLASVPPVYGLYTSFFPAIFYAFLATSKHISIGTFAVISLMVGDVVERRVPACPENPTIANTSSLENRTEEASQCEQEYDMEKVQYAIALSIAVGILHLVMYLFNLGAITKYLSDYLISAFTCAASFYVMTSQVPKLFAIKIPRQSGPLGLINTYILLFKNIASANPWDVLVSACSVIFLVIGKEINARYRSKLPFPPPWELLVVIFATIASYFGKLEEIKDVTVVGNIPTGIQVMIPRGNYIQEVMVDAIPIAVVLYAIEISLVQMFAMKHSYETDSNQELIALGVANIGSAFFGCFPCASSLSRAAIWDEVGGRSQLTGVIQSFIILIILMWIGPLFESLPQAALASIIVVNLKRLLLQFNQVAPLWRLNKLDAITWVVTWVAVMVLGVDLGLGVAVAFEILAVMFKMQMLNGHILGRMGETNFYKSSKHFKVDASLKGIIIFKYMGPIYFANKESFKEGLFRVLRYDPMKAAAKRRKKMKKINKKIAAETKLEANIEEGLNGANGSSVKLANHKNGVVIYNIDADKFNNDTSSKSIQISTDESSVETSQSEIQYLILDMSLCSFIDSDAAKLIKLVYDSLLELKVEMILAECNRNMKRILTEKCDEKRPPFFISIPGAIKYAMGETNLTLNEIGEIDLASESDYETISSKL